MLITIIIVIALALLGYVLRWNFRRFWHVLYTGDMEHDWEKLGAEYFIAPWEKRRFAQKKAAKAEAKKEASKTPADAVGK
jgi:hypothetical protein